jgi:HD-GYP domain-containing protein (c-di-GMP phosphodiesterase class II)
MQSEKQFALAAGASDAHVGGITPEELDSILQRRARNQAVLSNRLTSVRAEVLQKALRAISAAVDVKMRFPSGRSFHVTETCLAMAAEMGLSPEQMDRLEMAALLHDIGMVAVPDDVVGKPDSLDDLDWIDVLKHPALGSTMLGGVPELSEVAAAVRHHHERVDGQGYPDGLYGEAIPLFSRMIAVADAYEAMTTERPHREARSHSEAVAELRRNVGKQFDADLTEVLVKVLESREARRAA